MKDSMAREKTPEKFFHPSFGIYWQGPFPVYMDAIKVADDSS
jgi:hypothetical protein